MPIVIAVSFAAFAVIVAAGWLRALRRSPELFRWTTRDIVVAAALAVAVGMLFVAWSWAYQLLSVIPAPFNAWAVGFWMLGGTLVPYVVRRPGAAFMGEMVAALVEAPLVPWGVTTLISGLVQGLPAEASFALTGYRRWGLTVLMRAGAFAAYGGFLQEYYPYGISEQVPAVQIGGVILRVIGGAVLAGVLAKLIGDALAQTGVLEGLGITADAPAAVEDSPATVEDSPATT
jgi:energy-coupling factor transport system substrate-specific component